MSLKTFPDAEWIRIKETLAKITDPPNALAYFERWLDKTETQERLNFKYPEGWTLAQALLMWMTLNSRVEAVGKNVHLTRGEKQRQAQAVRDYGDPPDEESGNGDDNGDEDSIPLPMSAGDWEIRYKGYLQELTSWYKDIAPNDMRGLEDLASAYVEREALQMLSKLHSIAGKVKFITQLSAALAKQSTRISALEQRLHIDRASREREAEGKSDADAVLEVLDAAGDWVAKHSVKIVHERCRVPGVIGKSDIQFGILMWAFKECYFKLYYDCPRCGRRQKFEHVPSPADVAAATEPPWVDAHEQEYAAKERQLNSEQQLQELEHAEAEEMEADNQVQEDGEDGEE